MYERIIFIQGESDPEEKQKVLTIIDEQGPEEAIEYLSQWHYPGEHEVESEPAAGSQDEVHKNPAGYILIWNRQLEYVGLEFAV